MRKEMNTPLCTPISVEELLFYFGFLPIMQSPVFEYLSATSIWWECETLCGEDMQLSSHVRLAILFIISHFSKINKFDRKNLMNIIVGFL